MVRISRRIIAPALILVWALSPLSASAAKKWKAVAPDNGKPLAIKSGKDRVSYYELDAKNSIKVKVTGPGYLRAYSRTKLAGKKKEGVYGIVIVRDNEKRYLLSRSSKYSKAKLLAAPKTRLAKSKSMTFKVPAGEHEFAFSLPGDAKQSAFARFAFSAGNSSSSSSDKVKYIAYLPQLYKEEVAIVIKEQEYLYYRTTENSPVEIDVIGPTRIKVISRLEFDHSMRGDKPYRIQVSENKKVVQTSPFTGKISAVGSYKKVIDKVFGRGDTFFITVPEGRHRYSVSILEKGASALLRFYLPEKALGNELQGKSRNGSASIKAKRSKPLDG